jgi:phosphatidylglycerophosphate synthase
MKKSYFIRVKEIYAVQDFKEFYSRIFSGKISPLIAAVCCGTFITPNHLTLLMIPVGIAGGISLSLGSEIGFITGGLLFVFLNILDAADGELARYTNQTSDFGDYLDRIAHYMTNCALIIGFGFGLYAKEHEFYILCLTIVATSAIVGDDALRDLLVTCGIQKKDKNTSRKLIKQETKVSLGRFTVAIGAVTSNVAMFHLIPIISLIAFETNFYIILKIYFFCITLALVSKFIVRAIKITLAYG